MRPLLEYSFQRFSGLSKGITFGRVTIRPLFLSVAKSTSPKSRGLAALCAVFDRSGDMLVRAWEIESHATIPKVWLAAKRPKFLGYFLYF